MIRVRDLTVRLGGQVVLNCISLAVRQGECVLITGPSGCGKSTLLRVLTGLVPQAIPAEVSGEVRVDGVQVFGTQSPSVAEIAQHVGIVFQNPASQLFHLSVEEEIAFGPRNLGLSGEEIRQRVDWALSAVGIEELRARRPAELSGGQKQRVAIAAALAMQPRILVLDEPTASLDVPGTNRVMATLKGLSQQHGITVLLVEHRLAEAARLAERVIVMEQGQIAADGPTTAVVQQPGLVQRLGLRRLTEAPQTGWDNLLQTGRAAGPLQEPLLELKAVTAGYGRRSKGAILKEVSWRIYPGEFSALVGDNGAGKSTLALVAAGLLRPWSGQVRFSGGRRPRPGLDISLLFQNPADQLFTDSVDEEVAFAPRNYRAFQAEAHEHLLAESDLSALRNRRPVTLSAGQQQRTALAACLALQPRLVILDEPTLGQDWGHLQRIMNYLVSLNQRGTAILLITHDYKLVHRYAQRVAWMQAGRIRLDGGLR